MLASDTAWFQDSAHFINGLVPGDGVHVAFPAAMGLNRARYLLLTGQVLHAVEAKEMALVNEILPQEKLLLRAWELARMIMRQPELNRRYTRVLLTEQMRRQLNDLLAYGLALEGLAITAIPRKQVLASRTDTSARLPKNEEDGRNVRPLPSSSQVSALGRYRLGLLRPHALIVRIVGQRAHLGVHIDIRTLALAAPFSRLPVLGLDRELGLTLEVIVPLA